MGLKLTLSCAAAPPLEDFSQVTWVNSVSTLLKGSQSVFFPLGKEPGDVSVKRQNFFLLLQHLKGLI